MSNHILIERIKTEMTRVGLNARELAKRASVGDSFVYDVLSGKSTNPTTKKIAAIAAELDVSVPYLLDENVSARNYEYDYVAVPLMAFEPSIDGSTAMQEKKASKKFYFRKEWVKAELGVSPSDLRIIQVVGDSMEPTFCHKDTVLVDLSNKTPSPSGIFALIESLGVVIKRIECVMRDKTPVLKVHSDNPRYTSYEHSLDEANILGRIVWFSREI